MAAQQLNNFINLKDGRDFSRILYTNPVCFLVSHRPDDMGVNIMILSWLTPVNNKGLFTFSINKRRFTNQCLRHSSEFILSIPCREMEDAVLAVGKCSGKYGNKLDHLSKSSLVELETIPISSSSSDNNTPPSITGGIKKAEHATSAKSNNRFSALCTSDDSESDGYSDNSNNNEGGGGKHNVAEEKTVAHQSHLEKPPPPPELVIIKGSVAYLRCMIKTWSEVDDEHHVVVAQIEQGAVNEKYWNGKHFAPTSEEYPPYLTFLGSQTFGYTTPFPQQPSTLEEKKRSNDSLDGVRARDPSLALKKRHSINS